MSDFPETKQSAERPLRFGQFTLAGLFLLVTVVAIFCGLFTLLPLVWSWSIVLIVVMMALHVFGNVVGTRLSDVSEQNRQSPECEPVIPEDVRSGHGRQGDS